LLSESDGASLAEARKGECRKLVKRDLFPLSRLSGSHPQKDGVMRNIPLVVCNPGVWWWSIIQKNSLGVHTMLPWSGVQEKGGMWLIDQSSKTNSSPLLVIAVEWLYREWLSNEWVWWTASSMQQKRIHAW